MKTKTGERGLPLWPTGKPIPKFKTYEEEVKWWDSYDLAPPSKKEWKEIEPVRRTVRGARTHVFRLRFDDQEMAALQESARRRGVSMAVALRDLVHSHLPLKRIRKSA